MTAWPVWRRRLWLPVGVTLCAVAVVVAVRALRVPPLDLAVYRAGGHAVLTGVPLYRGPVFAGLDFTYPPAAALLFVPLAALPGAVAAVLMCAVNLVVLGVACALSLAALGVRGPGFWTGTLVAAGLTFWLDPVRTTVYLGQVNIILLALVLWDLLRPNGARGQGVGVGIAAGLKLTPLVFIAFLLVTRRFRAAATATAVFAATVVLGFLAVPRDAADYWWGGVFRETSRVFPDPASPHNQSLYGLLARVGGTWLWPGLAVLLLAAALAVAAVADGDRLLAVTATGLGGTAVSPYSWDHHWVWLVPLGVFAGYHAVHAQGWRRRLPWLVALAALVLFLPWIVDVADPPTGRPWVGGGPAFLLGNEYVLCCVAVLACGAWYVHRRRRLC